MLQIKTFLFIGGAALVAGIMLLEASRLFVSDLRFAGVQAELGFRGREGYQPSSGVRLETSAAIAQLLEIRPRHPDYLAAHANDLAWQAYWSTDREQAAGYLQQAISSQRLAIESRPARPQDRQRLAEYQKLGEQVQ